MPYSTMRDGAQLHYLDVGEGPTCVLLHGFAMFGAMWLPFVWPLARRYRFILPDLRGWGKSHDLPLSGADVIRQHANDVADLIENLELGRVRLAGLSMGACTSMQYLQDYGTAHVEAYLNIDQTPCIVNQTGWPHGLLGAAQADYFEQWQRLIRDFDPWRGHRFNRIPKALRRRMFGDLQTFVGHAFHRRTWRAVRHFAGREAIMRRVMPVTNWPVYLATMNAYVNGAYDWRAVLAGLDIPVTALIGAESVLYPVQGQVEIARYAPRTRIVKVPRAGHVVPFEAPRRFSLELRRFLRGGTGAAAPSSAALEVAA